MELHADFTRRAIVHASLINWVPSPTAGVERRMLDRIGGEVARATSLVRYAEGSRFPAHVHGGGEEFLVLDGVFQDEHGEYPAGSYVRNPPTSRHTPASESGCLIFVKLWQFDPADRTEVRLETAGLAPEPAGEGVARVPLFRDQVEDVVIETWEAGARIPLGSENGFELLVIDGDFALGADRFSAHSWIRLPEGENYSAVAGPAGTRVWVKRGHLGGEISGPPRK